MSKNVCPLCGGRVTKDENFCRNCQQIEKGSEEKSFKKKEEVTPNNMDTAPTIGEDEKYPSTDLEQPEKNTSRITKVDYILILGFLVVAGYTAYFYRENRSREKERNYWMECIDKNTSLNYADYLQKYPNGKFSNTAAEKIRELKNLELLEWNNLKASNDIDLFSAYLEEYPNTPHLSQIKNKIDMIGWELALKENTLESYRSYIENVDLGNYLGGFKDLAKERYNYHNQLETLEGKERETIIAKLDGLLQSIANRDTTNLKNIRGEKPLELYIIKEETSIIRDNNSDYFISTAALEIKDNKISNDTLDLQLKLSKALKIVRIEKSKRGKSKRLPSFVY